MGGGGFCFVTSGEFSEQGWMEVEGFVLSPVVSVVSRDIGSGGFCFVTSGEFSE